MELRNQEKYIWTSHARIKMRQYGLSDSRVKRIIRFPERIEEGIMENGVACMQKAGGKKYSEIWVMYTVVSMGSRDVFNAGGKKKLKIVTAWRYPGKSPERDPVPANILREIKKNSYKSRVVRGAEKSHLSRLLDLSPNNLSTAMSIFRLRLWKHYSTYTSYMPHNFSCVSLEI